MGLTQSRIDTDLSLTKDSRKKLAQKLEFIASLLRKNEWEVKELKEEYEKLILWTGNKELLWHFYNRLRENQI